MSNNMQLFFSLALVAGGLATYHVLVADDAGSTTVVSALAPDAYDLEKRVAALEGREPLPLLQGSADTAHLQNRLRDLERRLKAVETTGRGSAVQETSLAQGPGEATAADPAHGSLEEPASEGQPAKDLKKRVDSLVDRAISTHMQGRMNGRLDRSLEELGIELTASQRKKLDAAMTERMNRIHAIRRSGRESGLSREAEREQMAKVRAEFTETVSTFLSAADAQAIAEATAGPPGRGRGGPDR